MAGALLLAPALATLLLAITEARAWGLAAPDDRLSCRGADFLRALRLARN